nr:MAG TPA: hypothetical protein [Caudoviricetes sp.]
MLGAARQDIRSAARAPAAYQEPSVRCRHLPA